MRARHIIRPSLVVLMLGGGLAITAASGAFAGDSDAGSGAGAGTGSGSVAGSAPELVRFPNSSGECARLDASWTGTKFDVSEAGGTFDGSDATGRTYSFTTDGKTVSWTSSSAVPVVIVKGGTDAHVYRYDPPAEADGGLTAPVNPRTGRPYGVSHVTFCAGAHPTPSPTPEPEPDDPAAPEAALIPIVECVAHNDDGTRTALFGWDNTGEDAEVPVGLGNSFSPEPADRGQGATFAAGRHVGAVSVEFDPGAEPALAWSLGGATATAGDDSPSCNSAPVVSEVAVTVLLAGVAGAAGLWWYRRRSLATPPTGAGA